MLRRSFIQKSAMGLAAIPFSSFASSLKNNPVLKAGLIGAGWYGMVISKAALKAGGVEITAICDVDSTHLQKSAEEIEKIQGTKPRTFKSYHDVIDFKGLDIILIGTPPHWHALPFIAACEKGLHIYCEKPLSYDPAEGMAMVKAARKAGNVVQIGFQRRQSSALQYAKKYIEEGKVGEIQQIVAQIHYQPSPGDSTIQDPPASLDWDAWCGPAPMLPYRPSIGHLKWRLEKEYGNGHLFDWGIHHIDAIRNVMNEKIPSEFQSTGGLFALKDQITTPDTLNASMAFKNAPVVWQHRLWGTGEMNPEFTNGIFFHGEQASLFLTDTRVLIMPPGRNAEKTDLDIPTEAGMQELHMLEFLQAVRDNEPSKTSCPTEEGYNSTTTVYLAMLAYYSNSVVRWDNQKQTITDNPAAMSMFKRDYRKGYQHPG